MKNRLLIVCLLIAISSSCMGQTTYAHDLIPSTTGYNLGHDSQRWNGFIQNLNISGQTILPFRGYTQCLKVGPTGLLYADRNCATTGGGGAAAPPLYSVQFNNPLGTFAGSANLTYNPDTSTLNVGGTPAFGISITPPSPLTANYAQSLSAVNGPFTYAQGDITPGDCAKWYGITQLSDAGPCGSSTLTTQFTPPTTGTYAILYPTSATAYSGSNTPAPPDNTICASGGSGRIWRDHGSGLSDWDVWCNWTGFSLPSYVSAGSVTSVYAIQNSYANNNGGNHLVSAGQGTVTFNADILFTGTEWGMNGSTGQQSVLLASGGSASSFDFSTTSIVADNAASSGGTFNDQWNVNQVALVVFYTGTQTAQNPGVQIVPPLSYNADLGTLSMFQASATADGWLSHTDFTTFNNKASVPGTGVGVPQRVALGSPVTLTSTTQTIVLTESVTFPSATGTYRADVRYGAWVTAGANACAAEVIDTTNSRAFALSGQNSNGSGYMALSGSEISSGTYAAAATATFTLQLQCNATESATVNSGLLTFSPAEATYLSVTPMVSN